MLFSASFQLLNFSISVPLIKSLPGWIVSRLFWCKDAAIVFAFNSVPLEKLLSLLATPSLPLKMSPPLLKTFSISHHNLGSQIIFKVDIGEKECSL